MTDYSYLSQLNDEELWRLTVSGDARAEEELIERYTRLVRICARPYFLAGGLNPDNVTAALSQLHPFAVDVSSGIESDGIKDLDKMRAFVTGVRSAS